ncbi:unnamed protein product [Staurois parvus]|uniref:Uncharacterized protein n=1 Tax=Staurois parvus TaxID=386267 RepID=A0ABN9DIE2_9NEOB|nr:unnamed protein product [Staurois parvus]
MYINGRTGAVPNRVAVYKLPVLTACARSLGAPIAVRDLCVRSRFMNSSKQDATS